MSRTRSSTLHVVYLALGLSTLQCTTAFTEGDEDQDEADEDRELTLHDICGGTYECLAVRGSGTRVTLTFSRRVDDCYVEDIRFDDFDLTVRGTREAFRMCDNTATCMDCYAVAPAPAGSDRCTGTATPCSSIGASACSYQSGCQYRVGVDTTTTRDDDCGGTANDCNEVKSQERCADQRGCVWL